MSTLKTLTFGARLLGPASKARGRVKEALRAGGFGVLAAEAPERLARAIATLEVGA